MAERGMSGIINDVRQGPDGLDASTDALTVRHFADEGNESVTLIGADDQVAQYDWGDSIAVPLNGSGRILQVTLHIWTTGDGAAITEAGKLVLFDTNPATSAGDANLAAAEWNDITAFIDVAADDWFEENAGGAGAAATYDVDIPFESGELFAAYYHEGATTINSAAGDDEIMDANFMYHRYT